MLLKKKCMIGDTSMQCTHHTRREGGFTLIEVIVATAIVAIVIVVATAMLLVNFRAQRRAQHQLDLYAASRHVVQLINDNTRDALIDYDFYSTVPADEPEFLAIRDADGIQTVFWFDESIGHTRLLICQTATAEEFCDPGTPSNWENTTPGDIFFLGGAFTITPDTQPYSAFGTPAAVDRAPLIILRMQLGTLDTSDTSAVIQTAISPRFYVR